MACVGASIAMAMALVHPPLHSSVALAPARSRCVAPVLLTGDGEPAPAGDDGEPGPTDWNSAMQELNALKRELNELEQSPLSSSGEGVGADDASEAPGGFRFDTSTSSTKRGDDTVAGLTGADDKNLRLATIIGGRALTLITLGSLVFYIYVGVTGGITDGFDRYTEPIEDIRVTMEREAQSSWTAGD